MNLQISAMRFPNKLALVFMGQQWTYSQLQHQAEAIASALRKMGVQKGDRVVLDMQNCPQLVITHFAILRLDAVVVPVNPMNRMEELKHYILDPDTKVASPHQTWHQNWQLPAMRCQKISNSRICW